MARQTAYGVFLLLGVIWGSNFIFVKWAADWISPAQIVLLRVVFGFLPVLGYALATRALSVRHLRHAHHFLVMSLLATAVYYVAFAQGTALLPSSVAGMLSGAIPLFTFVCAWLFLHDEPLNGRSACGVGLGFLGVLLIARPWSGAGETVNLVGTLYMMGGSLSVGCSFVYARRFLSPMKLPAAALTTYQIGLAIPTLLLITDLQNLGAVFADTRAWVGLIVGLGLLGTGLAYILYYLIVETLGAVVASSATYLPPVVALLIGVLVAGEALHPLDLLAMGLILAGVAVLQGRRRAATSASSDPHRTDRRGPA